MVLISKNGHQEQPAKAFLARFEPFRRAHLSNLFLERVRSGVMDPEEIVRRVWLQTTMKAAHSPFHSEQTKYREYTTALEAHLDEAVLFARYCIAWEALPREERER